MSLDAIHYALAGVIVTLAGTIVALAKHSWSAVQKANDERLRDQKACAKKNENTLEKILPLAEALSSVAADMMRHMEDVGGNE